MHQGKTLRTYLKSNDVSVESFMSLVGKSRQTVYTWFEMEVLSDDVLDKLDKKAKIPMSIFDQTKSNIVSEPQVDYGKSKTKEHMDKMIEILNTAVNALSKDNEYFKSELKNANEIIYSYIKKKNSITGFGKAHSA